jgi:predicted dehydrogenase
MDEPLRYGLIGLGRRATSTYLSAFESGRVRERHNLVAIMDSNIVQLDDAKGRVSGDVSCYVSSDVKSLLNEHRPDVVIISTPDYAHAGQILDCLSAGVSVLVEKPITHSLVQANNVLSAEIASTAKIGVAHNLRFFNLSLYVKMLIEQGVLGNIKELLFNYHLSPGHGASYFLRWHRLRSASGGLSITKCCHHFDLINWWLKDAPVKVFGWQARKYFPGGTILTNPAGATVPFDADIEDVLAANISYKRGSNVSYTLNGCSNWEGFDLTIKGELGSLYTSYDKHGDHPHEVRVCLEGGLTSLATIPRESGRHCGADTRMLSSIFLRSSEVIDPLASLSTAYEGTLAVAIGAAIFESSRVHAPVHLNCRRD